jgi:hypothetical protein
MNRCNLCLIANYNYAKHPQLLLMTAGLGNGLLRMGSKELNKAFGATDHAIFKTGIPFVISI